MCLGACMNSLRDQMEKYSNAKMALSGYLIWENSSAHYWFLDCLKNRSLDITGQNLIRATKRSIWEERNGCWKQGFYLELNLSCKHTVLSQNSENNSASNPWRLFTTSENESISRTTIVFREKSYLQTVQLKNQTHRFKGGDYILKRHTLKIHHLFILGRRLPVFTVLSCFISALCIEKIYIL